jgi:hypothetical protein
VTRPGLTALTVSALAARLLPPIARLRFEEELLDELYALAEARAPHRRQLACAVRQLAAIPRLRGLRLDDQAAAHERRDAPDAGAI